MYTPSIARIGLSLLCVTACAGLEEASLAPLDHERLEGDVKLVAASFQEWGGPVDFQLRFGPADCMMPPITPRFSETPAGSPHGEKLYLIHASDAASYAGVDYSSGHQGGTLFPEDLSLASGGGFLSRRPELPELSREWEQILVKEAFAPVESAEPTDHDFGYCVPAERDGAQWVPGDPVGLFLMLRTARATPGTDEGWVYATLRADGEVTAYGQIPSCVECHRRAGPDRLFGLPGLEHEPSVRD